PVVRKRPPVRADEGLKRLARLPLLAGRDELRERNDQRRGARDPRLAVDELPQFGQRPPAVLRPRPCEVLANPPPLLDRNLALQLACGLLDVGSRVPDVDVAHRGELPYRLTVGTGDGRVDARARLAVEAAVATSDLEARSKTLDIPLERARQRLVEVIDAEH